MEGSLGEIRCGVFDSRSMRGWVHRTSARIVQGYELELFSEQMGVSHIGERAYAVRPAMLLCAKPGQVRYSELPVRCHYIRLGDEHRELARILSGMPEVTYLENGEAYEQILCGMDRLHRLLCEEEGETAEERLLHVYAVLYDILHRCVAAVNRVSGHRDVVSNRLVRGACAYIDEHFTHRCTLGEIAAHVHVSPNYLHTLFHREMGMTPLAYIMEKRVARARRLIMAGELTLLDIALGTGFCSQSHFNRVFRESTGETPAAYRRRWMENY